MPFVTAVHRPKRAAAYYVGVLLALLVIMVPPPTHAEGSSAIAQGFQTNDPDIAPGAIVSLQSKTPNAVELCTTDNLQQLLGVATSQSLIELDSSAGNIQVVTSGTAQTLVSDINGSINVGDKITISPIAGVGMKVTESGLILGTAKANFAGLTTHSQTITDKQGKQQTVHIATMPVQIDKMSYQSPSDSSAYLPLVLVNLANSVAGHQVAPLRIIIALLLITLLFAVVAVLMYSAVRSSILSIGRNPLSQQGVQKALLAVSGLVISISVVTAVLVYTVLTT